MPTRVLKSSFLSTSHEHGNDQANDEPSRVTLISLISQLEQGATQGQKEIEQMPYHVGGHMPILGSVGADTFDQSEDLVGNVRNRNVSESREPSTNLSNMGSARVSHLERPHGIWRRFGMQPMRTKMFLSRGASRKTPMSTIFGQNTIRRNSKATD